MIVSVNDYLIYNPNDSTPTNILEAKLHGIETAIRAYTNNNFQKRSVRFSCPVAGDALFTPDNHLKVGDTVQISQSIYNDGIYEVVEIDEGTITLNETLEDEDSVTVTKVVYPADIKIGVMNMMMWDTDNRSKVGIASETLSRHSVTFFSMDGDNSLMGFPVALTGFLEPYRKARF